MTGANASGEWQTCMFPDGVICEWGVGDGIGGTEESVGAADGPAECALKVLNLRPEANGATFSNTGGTGCYAEFGMTGANDSAGWQSCMFDGTVGR